MRYRLLAPHVTSDGRMLEEGMIVGEGDDSVDPWLDPRGEEMAPTTQMEGLDAESEKAIDELHNRLYGESPKWKNHLPEEQRKAREAEAKEQEKIDENSKPVSRTQALERKLAAEEEDDEFDVRDRPVLAGPARQPSHTSTASPTRGGVNTPAAGPAAPKPPQGDEARVKKPNEEQYPKG